MLIIVDHGILLAKLKLFGLNAGALKQFESYLLYHTQQVFIGGYLSNSLSL